MSIDTNKTNRALVTGFIRTSTSNNKIINPTKLTFNLEKSKTDRYEAHAYVSVQLTKSVGWPCEGDWFMDYPVSCSYVKEELLTRGKNHSYDIIFSYVYDRCLESCSDKIMDIEFGRKPQISTKLRFQPYSPETLWVYAHFPEALRSKLDSWVNSSFQFSVTSDCRSRIGVHSEGGTTLMRLWGKYRSRGDVFGFRYDTDSKWILENPYANSPDLKDTRFSVELSVELNALGIHPDVFVPDYFTRNTNDGLRGEMVKVFSSSGDGIYCCLSGYTRSSPVLEAQVRWNNPQNVPLTLDVPTTVLTSLVEFIHYSHVTSATKSFTLAVQLLFAANKYDVRALEDKLLDLFYTMPLSAFDDVEALVELYLLLEVTRISECVVKRISGIVKLKSREILSSSIYEHLNIRFKSLISCIINSYDVVLDIMSLWSDNRHNSVVFKNHENEKSLLESNARVQETHSQKPWQFCCDYMNYCNFKPNAREMPDKLVRVRRTYYYPNSVCYSTELVV